MTKSALISIAVAVAIVGGCTVIAVNTPSTPTAQNAEATPAPTPTPRVLWRGSGEADNAPNAPLDAQLYYDAATRFRPPKHWTVYYDYDCSMHDERQNFIIDTYGDIEDGAIVNDLDWKGSGSVPMDVSGEHDEWLGVETHCKYHVKAVAGNNDQG